MKRFSLFFILLLLFFLPSCASRSAVDAAYEEGYNAGYEEGYAKGRESGIDVGDGQGYKRGYSEGYSAGQTAEYTFGIYAEEIEQERIQREEALAALENTYVLNTNTHKFHLPTCPSVDQMKDKNKQEFTGTREEVIDMGYDPCGRCNP